MVCDGWSVGLKYGNLLEILCLVEKENNRFYYLHLVERPCSSDTEFCFV